MFLCQVLIGNGIARSHRCANGDGPLSSESRAPIRSSPHPVILCDHIFTSEPLIDTFVLLGFGGGINSLITPQ